MSPPVESAALAYFITFRTYGTWLQGDARGSTTRYRRTYDTPHVEPRPGLEAIHRARLASTDFLLDSDRREAVRAGIEHECRHYEWTLLALNVRTNHVHVVVGATLPPERVMTMLKSAGTRAMRAAGLMRADARAPLPLTAVARASTPSQAPVSS